MKLSGVWGHKPECGTARNAYRDYCPNTQTFTAPGPGRTHAFGTLSNYPQLFSPGDRKVSR